MEDLKNIIESVLFVAEEPLTIDRLRQVLEPAGSAEIREALQSLIEDYRRRRGGFLLKEVGGGFQFRTRPEYHVWIKRLVQPKPPRISKAALETLAIIAYKQPVIRNDVERIRGVDCGGVIRMLLERNLIRVLGRKEIPGRPLIYGTTKRFLEVFDLKDLKDLPTPREIESLGLAAEQRGLFDEEPNAESPQTENKSPALPDENNSGHTENVPPQAPDSKEKSDEDPKA
ncbi:MAG TPA: SMC-Scp complex subunit ScpB [Desulfobacterales bacterium]